MIVKKMSDLDNMLPNLDDLEQSIGAKVDPKKVTPADEILNKRANMDIFEIIDLVKDRVSIFGIYKLHDEVHIENSKLGAEIKLANSKLETCRECDSLLYQIPAGLYRSKARV